MGQLVAVRVWDATSPLGYAYRYLPCTKIGPLAINQQLTRWGTMIDHAWHRHQRALTHTGTGVAIVQGRYRKTDLVALARQLLSVDGWTFTDPDGPEWTVLMPKVQPIVEAFQAKMKKKGKL